MPRLTLSGGSYTARSLVAGAQRCLNLYPEPLPENDGEPAAVAFYPTPGLRILCTLPEGPVRGIRQATNGDIYVVAGMGVYLMTATSSTTWSAQGLGSIAASASTPVSMTDNSLTLVIVDGTSGGWTVDLATHVFAPIVDPTGSFRGATRVDYLDTFLLFNVPGTPQFQSSLSLSVTFDPLYFANKSSYPDLLATLVVAKRDIWLIGERSTEVWTDSGAPDFPFAAVPGVFIDFGCCAPYSVAQANNAIFWLSRDRSGQGIVLSGEGYAAVRISHYAIEAAIASYAAIADAVGFTYQLGGHTVYVLTFPTANATWCYDMATRSWHEWCWLDGQGVEHRHRAGCAAQAGGLVVVGDGANGNLYALDPAALDDAGAPIKRQRAFQHVEGNDGQRMFFRQFILNMEAGTADASVASPQVWLDWSDDRGHSWSNPLLGSLGNSGEYLTSIQYQRLGMARSRVFRATWAAAVPTVLLGAFIDVQPAGS